MTAIEDRLAVLSRLPGAVAVLIGLDGRTTYVSQAVEPTLGYDPDTFVGLDHRQLTHPDDLERALASWAAMLASPGGHVRWEQRVRHADGTWRWLEAVATNTSADPAIGAVLVNFRDVTDRKEAELALRASEARFRALVQNSYDVFAIVNPERGIVYASPSLEPLFGRPVDDLVGADPLSFIHPDDLEAVIDGYTRAAAAPGVRAHQEARILRADGTYRWIEATAVNLMDNEAVDGIVVNIRDITDRTNAERESRRLTDIFEATEDLVAMADRQAGIMYLNRAARRFFGLGDDDDLSGFDAFSAIAGGSADQVLAEIQPTLLDRGTWHGELEVVRADGTVVPHLVQLLVHHDDEGEAEFFSAVLHDISDRKVFEDALAHQAMHDPLTGLPNRTLLLDRLEGAIARARRNGRGVAVLFLDLDHFKVVNDSLGHALGDRLLVAIAHRLQAALRPADTVARFGGDEFVVLCEDVSNAVDATAIAARLDAALRGPFAFGEAEAYVGVSIGIALADPSAHPLDVPDGAAPGPADPPASAGPAPDPGTLIRDADAAMYQAKERGRGRWVVFDRAMRASAVDRLDTENALRRALERHELRVHYQPVVDLAGGAVCGVEALVRWEHPTRGLLAPNDYNFVRLAEETGLIVPIGTWVLEQACRQVRRWERELPDVDPLVLSVNLSGRQLGHADLAAEVTAILDETGLDPRRLELEITESVLMEDIELTQDTLDRLRRLGVRLVIDDFGTGYSSLAYLRRFPVDHIKVDQSFVHGLGRDERDTAIVASVLDLARTLGLGSVGEGVETAGQLAELRRLGCQRAQGFHLARPTSGEAVGALLATGQRW